MADCKSVVEKLYGGRQVVRFLYLSLLRIAKRKHNVEDFPDQENNTLTKVSYNESALADWNRASEYQHHHLYELSKLWPTAHYWMTISRLYHDTYSGNISAGYIITLIVAICLILSSFWTNV